MLVVHLGIATFLWKKNLRRNIPKCSNPKRFVTEVAMRPGQMGGVGISGII